MDIASKYLRIGHGNNIKVVDKKVKNIKAKIKFQSLVMWLCHYTKYGTNTKIDKTASINNKINVFIGKNKLVIIKIIDMINVHN